MRDLVKTVNEKISHSKADLDAQVKETALSLNDRLQGLEQK